MIDVYKSQFLAVIMTGMGHDGTQACRQLKQTGARLIAQSESSCVVFGMPKLPIIEGIVDEVLDLNEISSGIIRLVEGGRTP
jgi:two-component system chemotaxis response regulator CheB